MTFWDAGEFVAAAHGLGIPHPPGTPLYVAIGRAWTLLLSPVAGAARAMNLLSASCTALAGAGTAWIVTRETRARADAAWGAVAGALCAGLMATAWSNATETEVYAVALLHVVLMLACALRAGEREGRAGTRWMLATAYLIALAPAVHLSALVGAPAAIVLAAMRNDGRMRPTRALALAGTLVLAAGVGRVSPWIAAAGAIILLASPAAGRDGVNDEPRLPRERQARAMLGWLALVGLAASALLIMLVRARHDPPLNQGSPDTLAALADVVARRQYDVAAPWPRQAPLWLQLANVIQYADWQAALSWGRGIFTTPARVAATLAFGGLAVAGYRAMRRDAHRAARALVTLFVCGTLGVAVYLNLKAGSSLGWGVLPDSAPHEARERDYFFVLGFWAWGCLAGYGALALARRRGWPAAAALVACVVPLAGNWSTSDRTREPVASAARDVALALLESTPPRGVLFAAGDNDSYPLWYAQQVEGARRDVVVVTVSLLPATWYQAELSRRSGLDWRGEPAPKVRWQHEQIAAQIAGAARRAGRAVIASPSLTSTERALLGGSWRLEGMVYRSHAAGDGRVEPADIDTALTARWLGRAAPYPDTGPPTVDDVATRMRALLACPRLAVPWAGAPAARDSLEVKCNLR